MLLQDLGDKRKICAHGRFAYVHCFCVDTKGSKRKMLENSCNVFLFLCFHSVSLALAREAIKSVEALYTLFSSYLLHDEKDFGNLFEQNHCQSIRINSDYVAFDMS